MKKILMFMAIMIAVVFVTSCGSKPKEKPKPKEIPFVSQTKENLKNWIDNNAINPEDFIMEVIAATFIAVIIVAYLIIPFGIFGAISLCFIQCIKLCNIVYLNSIIVIYLIFLHNL